MEASAHDATRSTSAADRIRINLRGRGGALLLAAALAAAVAVLPARGASAELSLSPVVLFMTTTEVPDAWSALVRSDNGVAATFHSGGLAPGSTATLWWVFFNNPAACVDGCNAPDLANPAVLGSANLQASVHEP